MSQKCAHFGLCDAYLKKTKIKNDQKVFDVDTIRYVVYPRYKLGFQYTVECFELSQVLSEKS